MRRNPDTPDKAVILDLGGVVMDRNQVNAPKLTNPGGPSSALEHFDTIEHRLRDRQLALFTDYDGTLTPIVQRPEMAILSDELRSQLQALANQTTVAIISGRDLADVQHMVGLPSLYYAGSHGFDIAGPNNIRLQHKDAQPFLPDLDKAEIQLREQLNHIAGARIERKRFAIAIHYREAAEQVVDTIKKTVDTVLNHYPQLRQRSGKKIFEIQPDIPWDKGRAIYWLLNQLGLNQPGVLPLYLGDDTTDEDAFQALKNHGVSIYVGAPDKPTQADYFLQDPDEVKQFFQILIQQLKRRPPNHG